MRRGKGKESIMKKMALYPLVSLALIVCLHPSSTFAQQRELQEKCAKYSDTFDTYDIERWQEVLLYSRGQGTVTVDNGQLVLKASEEEPTEIEVYALFTFLGDFDIQADYDISNQSESKNCRFNVGMVMQTLGDERSYKCYVAKSPQEGLFFRSRMDLSGEKNVEKHKGAPAQKCGKIRIIRKDNVVSFSVLKDNMWTEIYGFQEPCKEKLRLRFKLQTANEEAMWRTCPAVVKFDNFIVNSCDIIVQE